MNKHQTDLSNYAFGKIPPQARDMEEVILGAMLMFPESVADVDDLIRPEFFYVHAHQLLCSAIFELSEAGKKVDILTVTERLRKRGELEDVGGAFYVGELAQRVGSPAHIRDHCEIIREKYMRREAIATGSKIINIGYDDSLDFDQECETLIGDYERLRNEGGQETYDVSQVIVERRKRKQQSGVPTAFSGLTKVTGGWADTNLIVVAARPGIGKTAWMLADAVHSAQQGYRPLIFSVEMSREQLVGRMVSMISGVPATRIERRSMTEEEYRAVEQAEMELSELPIYINDSSTLYDTSLRSKIRVMQRRFGITHVYVDYIQRLQSRRDKTIDQVSDIARACKSSAKDCGVPVIAFSQLNRSVESEPDRIPKLEHLRESGTIEQEADMVIFLYRRHYYYQQGIEKFGCMGSNPWLAESVSSEGYGEMIIGKNRHGSLKRFLLEFRDKMVLWKDYNEDFL